MSADNVVAILKTPDGKGSFEYRVIHATAIDNLWFTDLEWHNEDFNETGNPVEIVRYYEDAKVFTDPNEVYAEALRKYKENCYVEYGIQEYSFPKTFEQYVEEAKKLPKYKWDKEND